MATARPPPLPWWRRWSKKDWTIVAIGLTVILFVLSVFSDSRRAQYLASSDAPLVSLSLVRDAKEKGARKFLLHAFSPHFRCSLSLLDALWRVSVLFDLSLELIS